MCRENKSPTARGSTGRGEVPKIDAPTVAEHHRQRRANLLAAATRLLGEGSLDAVTLAAVGEAVGLSRSSVYQYFDSTSALLAAVVEDAFPRAAGRIERAMGTAATPVERIDAHVRVALDLATDPTHRSLEALANAPLPPECRARIGELHEEQYAPLRAALTDHGAPDSDLAAGLILGLLQSANRAIAGGAPRDRVLAATLRLIHQGVGSRA
jgi:AcrR family transcriptional regulator